MVAAGMKNCHNLGENINLEWFSSVSGRITKLLKKKFRTYTQNTTLLLPANFDINIVSE